MAERELSLDEVAAHLANCQVYARRHELGING
jgi:hypothetical protein